MTTPLLTLITQQSMDEDYLLAAERRVLSGMPPARRSPRRAGAVVLAVFGVLVATAGVQTARNADVDDASRNTLIARVEASRDDLGAREERLASLREETASLESSLSEVARTQQRAATELRRLQARTGFVAVTGPGIRVVVEDKGLDRIRKEDLFLLINGLWQAGAEAVSLNGHRLSAQTSINNSGVQINVGLASLRPPYHLLAIGDPRALQSNFVETSSFARFSGLRSQYGFGLNMKDETSIEMPAARLARLVSVQDPATPRGGIPERESATDPGGADENNEETAP